MPRHSSPKKRDKVCMLVEISIDNLGVIPHSHVEFAPGLNLSLIHI